jgi:hypothetical protein
MIHVNVWSQSLDSGVSVAYKGRRKAPRYCHELEIAFADGNAISIWGVNAKKLKDMARLITEAVESIPEDESCEV